LIPVGYRDGVYIEYTPVTTHLCLKEVYRLPRLPVALLSLDKSITWVIMSISLFIDPQENNVTRRQ
jgi:hypothetical protein